MNEWELCEAHQVSTRALTGVLPSVCTVVYLQIIRSTTAIIDYGSCKISMKRTRKNKNRGSHAFSHHLDGWLLPHKLTPWGPEGRATSPERGDRHRAGSYTAFVKSDKQTNGSSYPETILVGVDPTLVLMFGERGMLFLGNRGACMLP